MRGLLGTEGTQGGVDITTLALIVGIVCVVVGLSCVLLIRRRRIRKGIDVKKS